jgi:Fanconi anemia group M protein
MRSLLEELGAVVAVERLPAGDYAVAEGCLVERKNVIDLHDTLIGGRLWVQLGRLRRMSTDAYLLVEGERLDGPVRPDAIRGALLAAMELGIGVIRSRDRADSAAWMYRLAHRRQARRKVRLRPAYSQRPSSPPDRLPEAMLGALPSFSTLTARALLDEFGTIAGLVSSTPTEWTRVRGVGPKRSRTLAEALFEPAASRSAQRNGPRPST